jgi:plasmid maintenance system antidote protein VapI
MPWLRQRLRAVNATATDLARHLEIAPARVYEMIKGQRQFQSREIEKVASFLKIDEPQLVKLIKGRVDVDDVSISTANAVPWTNVNEKSVRLLRTTIAPHGRWLLHGAISERKRPELTRFSVVAFAIVVQDDGNSPVFRARDRVLIDPEISVAPGDDVVLSSVGDIDIHEDMYVIPGLLTKMTESAWSLKQYAGISERTFSKRQFPSAWKIVSRITQL